MNQARVDTYWRRMAIGSFVTLLCVALAWNAAAFAIDSSRLEQGIDSWGVFFGSALITLVYGSAPILLSLSAALFAGFGASDVARPCAWWNATIAAVCSVALLLLAGLTVAGPPAEAAFSVVSALLALVLMAPVVLCVRKARSEHS
jgi:hypothetical protein